MDIQAIKIQTRFEALKAIDLLMEIDYGHVSDKLRKAIIDDHIDIDNDYLVLDSETNSWVITNHIIGEGIDIYELKSLVNDKLTEIDLKSHSLVEVGTCYLIYDVNKNKRFVVTDKEYADEKYATHKYVVKTYSLYEKVLKF